MNFSKVNAALSSSQMIITGMEIVEESVIQNLNFPMTFFQRYLDDCVIAVPKITCNLLKVFNSIHPKLQCICETEENNA